MPGRPKNQDHRKNTFVSSYFGRRLTNCERKEVPTIIVISYQISWKSMRPRTAWSLPSCYSVYFWHFDKSECYYFGTNLMRSTWGYCCWSSRPPTSACRCCLHFRWGCRTWTRSSSFWHDSIAASAFAKCPISFVETTSDLHCSRRPTTSPTRSTVTWASRSPGFPWSSECRPFWNHCNKNKVKEFSSRW